MILLSDRSLSSGANNLSHHSLLHQRIIIIEMLRVHVRIVTSAARLHASLQGRQHEVHKVILIFNLSARKNTNYEIKRGPTRTHLKKHIMKSIAYMLYKEGKDQSGWLVPWALDGYSATKDMQKPC